MKTFLQKYNQEFESSSSTTPQWNSFYKTACATFRKGLSTVAKDIIMSKGHFYFSGFFTTTDDRIFYFSISDVRHFPDSNLLIRTAKSYKDYTGGCNQYIKIDMNMFSNIENLVS